ncbi:MAG: EAL domain-containing protein [Rhodanobacteraceae bacterium]|nr:MAG: EAL domain-containing protein [Rhodanobacteraceae bacterium]
MAPPVIIRQAAATVDAGAAHAFAACKGHARPPRFAVHAALALLALAGCIGGMPGARAAATTAATATPTHWQAYQRDFYFQQLNGRNGLAQNSVSLVFQDHTGFMWFATQGGLFRYDGYTLTRYSHDPDRADSLPENYKVTALADAGDGLLWVGSSMGGLVLFDPDTNRTQPLPTAITRRETSVTSLLRLPDGDLLIGGPQGVDRLQGGSRKPSIRPIWAEPAGTQLPVAVLTRCSDGRAYASAGSQVIALDLVKAQGRVLATAGQPINDLVCAPDGHLLLGTARGLSSVNPADGTLHAAWQAKRAGVVAIAVDHARRLWLALSDHSLLRLDPDGSQIRVQPAPLGIDGGLPDSTINTLLVDRTGMLWVGTHAAGVVWTRTDREPIEAALNLNGDLRQRAFVRSFQPAAGGRLWVALGGAGLALYDPATRMVSGYHQALANAVAPLYPHASGTPAAVPVPPRATNDANWFKPVAPDDVRVLDLATLPDGQLLLATNQGILEFNPATGTAAVLKLDGKPDSTPTRTLLRARNGDLWTAVSNAGGLLHYHAGHLVRHFDTADGLASNNVMALVEGPHGNIWAGTTNGVSVVNPASGRIRTLREVDGDPHSLAGHTVISLLFDRKGGLWAGSLSGISYLQHPDASSASFQRFTLKDGLPDSTINCLLEDAGGHIWFSTNLGLGRLDPATGAVRTFGESDGTQGNEYDSGACLRTADNVLLFGGNGFDLIHPARLRAPGPPAPIAFTSIYSSHGRVPLPPAAASVLRLGAADRTVYATFSTFDYAASTRNRYRTRLLGTPHPRWSRPTTDHSAGYTGLAPGHYELEVQSLLRNGSPGNIATLRFQIPVAWWWSLPMRIVYVAAFVLLVLIALLGWRSHHQEQVRYRRQLRLRETRLRQALWGSGDEFWDWNLERGTILRLGPEGAPGGHHEESIAADEWRATMVHPDDLASLDHALAEHIAGHTGHFEVEHRVRGRDAEWTWVISRGRIVERDANGKPLRICGTERDISVLRAADSDRRIATEVIRNMSEAVTVTDLNFRFISVNTAFTRMTGYAEHEVLGRDSAILNGSRHGPGNYDQLRQTLAETGHWRGELWQRRKDGEEFLCWVELNEVRDASGERTHLIGVRTDITDRKRAEQELRYLANYDTLTGLPNRALLGERLGAAVISARRSGQKVGLLFLDLDRFKHVNDSLGHTAGDRTLKAAGARLRQCVRETDVVARLGGDEFTVVLENLTDLRGAEDMAHRLVQAFVRPLPISANQEAVISPSIGIALYPDHGQTPADLLKCADTAMYQAKERGRNTWAVYHAGMDARARGHANMTTALRRALERNELSMVYQPKLVLADGSIAGMEALLRWHSPELGEISPSEFIPLAEETGQIHDISAYVFSTACADLRRFRESGHRHLTMAINLSVAQLNRPDLTLHICDMLAEHDVAPNQVELELTESVVMANADQSVRLLGELKSIGTRLAIDDFGTGYSSLAYLKRLPIDTLKIDQSFVQDITTDPDDAAITSTIITMAHSLQIRVVAEGVETAAQLAFLRAQRCDEIQGYWFSRPLTADACLTFLDQHATTSVDPA